jgi:hypothetical protein
MERTPTGGYCLIDREQKIVPDPALSGRTRIE